MSAALVLAFAPACPAPAGIALHPIRPEPAPMPRRYARVRPDDGPEASAWLRARPGRRTLAPRRFASSAEALAFVQRLRAAGASRVFVPATRIRPRGFAEEADTLAFEVGSGRCCRALVEAVCAEESCDWELPLSESGRGWIRWR